MTNVALRDMVSSAGLSGEQTARVLRVLEEYLAELERGGRPHPDELLARHPDLADLLKEYLDRLDLLHEAAVRFRVAGLANSTPLSPVRGGGGSGVREAAAPVDNDLGRLGDFQLLREVGRGGMGIVYEAEQISLRRRVALKVLPFAATMDARQLRRFQTEARAAAGLHHTNIVPVHFVGSERGVNYYAMQFIDGQDLASVLGQQRAPGEPQKDAPRPMETEDTPAGQAVVPTALPGAPTRPIAGLSTERSPRSREHFRAIARLGIQAAEALDHAHQQGIVHRDIKPANLLVDADGRLWVTDFGLAHIQSDSRLTMTGDVVGTLRYMSPEQALAKRGIVDHRTDIYSLGATLYELLTLEPVFAGVDRQELLRQIAFEEPKAPRRINKAIPAELEIIVLKALEKNSADRYSTAQELADDLDRFVKDEPIRARRPSWRQVALKWTRRHRSLVMATALVLVMAALLGGGGWLWWAGVRAGAEREARTALEEAIALQRQEKWPEALSAIRRARAVLTGVGAPGDLQQEIDGLAKDLEMIQRLEEAHLRNTFDTDRDRIWRAEHAALTEAFAWYGLDLDRISPREAGERIGRSSLRVPMAAALDKWARQDKEIKGPRWRALVAVARAADPDPWRNRLRDTLDKADPQILDELAASAQAGDLLPATAICLGSLDYRHIDGKAAGQRVLNVLRTVQHRFPANFWLHHQLVEVLDEVEPGRMGEAARHLLAAVVLRPESPGAHLSLGVHLDKGRSFDEAIQEFREAIRLSPDYEAAWSNLGIALSHKGLVNEAITAQRKALALNENNPVCYVNLGINLVKKDQIDDAIAAYQKAIALKSDCAEAYYNLGAVLEPQGRLKEAMAAYRKAIALNKNFAPAYSNLGVALHQNNDYEEAIAAYQKAIALDKNSIEPLNNLALALLESDQFDSAMEACRKLIARSHNLAQAYSWLGRAFAGKGRYDDGLAACRMALVLDAEEAEAHSNLAWLLATAPDEKRRDPKGALAAARKAMALKPREGDYMKTLGVALYRNGQWNEAIATFDRMLRFTYRRSGAECFFLAMAHWQLGDKDNARIWYDRGVEVIDKHRPRDAELRRFRAEAAALLGIRVQAARERAGEGVYLLLLMR